MEEQIEFVNTVLFRLTARHLGFLDNIFIASI